MRGGEKQGRQDEHPDRYERAAATGGNDRARGHDGAAHEHHVVAVAPESARPMEHPPEPEASRPEKVEVLRGIRVVGIRAELSSGRLMDARSDQKQQLPRALEPLNNPFQPQQPAVDRQHPEQAAQPSRKELRLGLAARAIRLALRPLLRRWTFPAANRGRPKTNTPARGSSKTQTRSRLLSKLWGSQRIYLSW